jgi:hypothetical protein
MPTPRYITPDEARQIFDDNARYYLDMSGDEFLFKWRNGGFGDVDRHPDHLKIMEVASLLTLLADDHDDE